MNYRTLGKSEMLVSEVSFGCMSLGNDHDTNAEIIHAAIEAGINFFDTADLYDKGNNEITLGKAIRDYRGKVFIATKVGNQWQDNVTWTWNPSKRYILGAVEHSLQRLKTDYIDLYELHGGTIEDPIDETIEAFELLKTQGKIRHYGISSIRPNVIREYVKRSGITSVMMQYSLLDRRPEEQCLELIEKNNIGILARGALAKGLLVGKPAEAYQNFSKEEVQKIADAIRKTEKNPTGISLGFVLNSPAVTSAVIGIRTLEQLRDIISHPPEILSSSELATLRLAAPQALYEQHR